MSPTEKTTSTFERLSQAVFLLLALATPVLSYAASWGAIRTEVVHFQSRQKELEATLAHHAGDRRSHAPARDLRRLEHKLERLEDKLDRLTLLLLQLQSGPQKGEETRETRSPE